jgi:hypothetical protein
MAYFAKLGTGNIVEKVISINNSVITDSKGNEQEQLGIDFINKLYNTNDTWKKVSYNTVGGLYYTPNTGVLDVDQSKSFRKNFPNIGYIYDESRDAFIAPKPHNSWVLNENTCKWNAPISYPQDGNNYTWNEETLNWVLQAL